MLGFVSHFCDVRLGKGVVRCKDTPNFIGNRIGSFWGSTTAKIMIEDGYTIEEVEALTGAVIGLPNSASFRLLDLVGLDVWAFVARNLYEACRTIPGASASFRRLSIREMMKRGWLGREKRAGILQARR